MILIATMKDDIHGLEVQEAVRKIHNKECHIVESDNIFNRKAIHWHCSQIQVDARMISREGTYINLDDVKTIWWRRGRSPQHLSEAMVEKNSQVEELIRNDCRGGFIGALRSASDAVWVSNLSATDAASDKLTQLRIATKCGFHIPETLVTQDYESLVEFSKKHTKFIAKPIIGANGAAVFTEFVNIKNLRPESVEICPAIYQEYVEGDTHIRLNAFGRRMIAASITTDKLDWRRDLAVPIRNWVIPEALRKKVSNALAELDLKMGIFDFKIGKNGEVYWLEVNPQGQFLFLEAIAKLPLKRELATYLVECSS
jgi:predicted ATP-grasp superfamily ATP-dependent carboligase